MIWHDAKLVVAAMWTAAWWVAGAASDAVSQVPAWALGAVGFAALVWRLLRDNRADSFLRDGYERLIEAERQRAAAAEARCAELEERIRRLIGEP